MLLHCKGFISKIFQATLIISMIVVAKIFSASFTAFLVYKFGLKKRYFLGCILMSSGIFKFCRWL